MKNPIRQESRDRQEDNDHNPAQLRVALLIQGAVNRRKGRRYKHRHHEY